MKKIIIVSILLCVSMMAGCSDKSIIFSTELNNMEETDKSNEDDRNRVISTDSDGDSECSVNELSKETTDESKSMTESTEELAVVEETTANMDVAPTETEVEQVVTTESNLVNSPSLTQEQAYNAVVNYCYASNPTLADIAERGYSFYWYEGDSTENEYVIIFRSYTGAFVYYHVNIYSGDVYTMEYMPGITDEEVPGADSFNAFNYL